MMISDEQRNLIKEWLANGASLADVQKNLKEECQLTMTYMDVRLLVLEIGAEVQEEPEPEPKPEPPAPTPPPVALDPSPARPGPWVNPQAADGGDPEDAGAEPEPSVSLSIDRIVVPGAMISGDVTFSDGVKAHWMIDHASRCSLEPEQEGYQPTEMDLQMFQAELRVELQRKGYAS